MELEGFVNPTGDFPAVVVPVWKDQEGDVYGAFRTGPPVSGSGVELVKIARTSEIYSLPEFWTDRTVEDLGPDSICLIALSADKLVAYPLQDEFEIITALLADPAFASDRPFVRLGFAKLAASVPLVIAELLSAASYLFVAEVIATDSDVRRRRLENWLRTERESISDYLGASLAGKQFIKDFPTSLEDLRSPVWWRGQLAPQGPRKLYSLREIEDRRPSPRMAAILNIEPKVGDDDILGIMGRHLMFGTKYVFFHSPSASEEALERLREATSGALSDAKKRLRGPLSRLTPAVVGTVEFYELDREWTGSPFVFYEEVDENGERTVTGYRGIDVGASIARAYEELPRTFAYELLEALSSAAPTKLNFEARHPGPILAVDNRGMLTKEAIANGGPE